MFFKPMLAKVYGDFEKRLTFPLVVQPKLDGIRCLWDGEHAWPRSGKRSINIGACLQNLLENVSCELDGELFAEELKFEEISSAVRTLSGSGDPRIQYWVYDMPGILPFEQRSVDVLTTIGSLGDQKKIVFTPTNLVQSVEEIEYFLKKYLDEGFEGVMVRDPRSPYQHSRSRYLLKLKPSMTEKAIVVGFIEGKGKHLGRLGALQVRGNGWECNVGTGFSDVERMAIWVSQADHVLTSVLVEFQERTKYGVPRFPRFKGFVEEEPT